MCVYACGVCVYVCVCVCVCVCVHATCGTVHTDMAGPLLCVHVYVCIGVYVCMYPVRICTCASATMSCFPQICAHRSTNGMHLVTGCLKSLSSSPSPSLPLIGASSSAHEPSSGRTAPPEWCREWLESCICLVSPPTLSLALSCALSARCLGSADDCVCVCVGGGGAAKRTNAGIDGKVV